MASPKVRQLEAHQTREELSLMGKIGVLALVEDRQFQGQEASLQPRMEGEVSREEIRWVLQHLLENRKALK